MIVFFTVADAGSDRLHDAADQLVVVRCYSFPTLPSLWECRAAYRTFSITFPPAPSRTSEL